MLIWRNDTAASQTLALGELVIASQNDETVFEGSANSLHTLPPGGCIAIVSQTQPSEIPSAWNCRPVHNRLFLPTISFFWRESRTSTVFEIRVGDVALAECPAVRRGSEGQCEFNWPMLQNGG